MYKFQIILNLFILINFVQINCENINRRRQFGPFDGTADGAVDGTAKPQHITYDTTEVTAFNKRIDLKTKRHTTMATTIAITKRRMPQTVTGIININVKVSNKNNRNKTRRNKNKRNNRRTMRRRPVTFFQRLQLLFSRPSRGFTPLLSRLFRPQANRDFRPNRRRTNAQIN